MEMKTSERKKARLVARVSDDVQHIIQKAASYSGATVTQFLIDSALDKANKIIKDMEVIKLSDEAATQMMELLDNPREPSAYLLRAKASYEKNIKYVNNRATKQIP